MKQFIARNTCLILMIWIVLSGCSNDNSVYQEQSEKYSFTTLDISIPRLDREDYESTSDYGFPITKSRYLLNWENHRYVSDISNVKNLDEDLEYQLMDEYESVVRNSLDQTLKGFKIRVEINVSDAEEKKKLLMNGIKVDNRKFHSYSSYKEASIEHSNYLK